MSNHELKILPQPFEDLLSGAKTGEVRDCRDRDFKAGDTVLLLEISGLGIEDGATGRSMTRKITHVQTGFGLPDGICVLSYAAPAAQAVDEEAERAKFEQFHRKNCESYGMYQADIDSEFERDDDGEYIYSFAKDGWTYWKARAALAAPVQSEQEPVGWQFYSRYDDEWRNPTDDFPGHRERMEYVGYQTRDVYAAPVRAVRMPSRFVGNVCSYQASMYASGWNACLDEVARLNSINKN